MNPTIRQALDSGDIRSFTISHYAESGGPTVTIIDDQGDALTGHGPTEVDAIADAFRAPEAVQA